MVLRLTILSVFLMFGSQIDEFSCHLYVWLESEDCLSSSCMVRRWTNLSVFPMFGFRIILSVSLMFGSQIDDFVCLLHACLVKGRLRLFSSYIALSFKILFVFLMFGSYIGSFSVFTMLSSQNDDFDYFLPPLFWVLRFCLSSSCLVLILVVFLSLSCLVLRMTTLTALLMFGSEFDDFVGFAQVWFWNKMRNSSKIQSDDVVWFSVCIVLRQDAVCIPRV